jgi:hypothetical protein
MLTVEELKREKSKLESKLGDIISSAINPFVTGTGAEIKEIIVSDIDNLSKLKVKVRLNLSELE